VSARKTFAITHPFPLRPDFNVSAVLPDDLTTAEAERLSKWILTLGLPAPKEGDEDG
jgi:hypothetical protein